MASRPPAKSLPYGSYGHAFYDICAQHWRFQRDDRIRYALRPFGEAEVLHLPSTTTSADLGTTAEQVTNLAPRLQSRLLAKSLQAITSTRIPLASLLRESDSVTRVQDQHDPTQGTLFASGLIRCESTRRAVPVLAHVTGRCGSDLRIVCLATVQLGWEDSKQIWLDFQVPIADEATWAGVGCPIQQVCLAPTAENRASPLALRFHSKTTIFQPVLRQAALAELDGSRLDPNPVCDIFVESTGGTSHADVAFNPWKSKQFAIVDRIGLCTIWELEGRNKAKARLVCTIHPAPEGTGPESQGIVGDGWARVQWINSTTVMICTRQDAKIFDITGRIVTRLCTAWTAASPEKGWLQDVMTLVYRPDYVAILDVNNLSLLQLQRHAKGEVTVQSVLSVRHYLDGGNMSLKLVVSRDNNGYFFNLRSRFSSSSVVYRCSFDENRNIAKLTVPSELDISPAWLITPNSKGISDIILRPAITLSSSNAEVTGTTASVYHERSVRFFAMYVLTFEHCLHLQLVAVAPSSFPRQQILPLTWEKSHVTSAAKAPRESFVVPDGTEDGERSEGIIRREPVSTFSQKQATYQTSRNGVDWSVDYARSVQNLQQGITRDAGRLLHRVGKLIESANASDVSASPGFKTLRNFATEELVLNDIDDVASSLHDLHQAHQHPTPAIADDGQTHNESMQLILQSVDQPKESRLFPTDGGSRLPSVYDQVVATMISPLSSDVAGRVRLAKEQLARSIAAEVTFASYITRPSPVEIEPPTTAAQVPSPKPQWEIPVRSGRLETESVEHDTEPRSRAALPTPSATPSIATGTSSQPSSFAAPELNNLMRYTTFSEPLPSTFPRSLRRVLSHWVPGEDVDAYDWISTSRHLTRQTEAEDADSQLTAKERARLQRRAERHIRRQRREAAASQAQQLASSRLPALAIAASQPVARSESQQPWSQAQTQSTGSMGAMLGGSQTVDTGMRVASQLVPGRFGGRAPPKKKRKQGF